MKEEKVNDPRDGNWIDKFGCCRVCDGEIPYGHTENCDIYKQEKEISRISEENKELKSSYAVANDIAQVFKERAENAEKELSDLRAKVEKMEAELEIIKRQRDDATAAQASAENRLKHSKETAKSVWDQHENQFAELNEKLNFLVSEVGLTLIENSHLADGENCTLSRLKKALSHLTGEKKG